ncbi:MAG: division/cell wall cluster transcriptional repressor MraZ [Anaerolineae bacterium]|jgi:MraZ protein
MLLGEFRCAADSDGRLTIPAELRADLLEGATVTRGVERCLLVYPAAEWKKVAEKMRDCLPLTNRAARAFTRLLFSGASACTPDKRGEMPLPEALRRYADIADQAVVVGLLSHLEIWNPGRWREMRSELVQDGVALAEELGEFGI